ncbi:MAG: cupin domain-containing protein [Eubacteriaceae bacterium]|nr:cupin domain-containing protein [Eubacteriaceae bacterium]
MLEQIYSYSLGDIKNIEKTVNDDHVNINHMIFPKGSGLPEHYSNSNVYMIIIQGCLSLKLDDQEIHEYPSGQIIYIPYHAKMNVNNFHDDILELFVVKSPNPKYYKGQ